MNWTGKVIGALLGYAVGGFWLALLGLFLGHLVDRARVLKQFVGNAAQVQKVFFEATFGVMGYVCKADGQVSPEEIQIAERLMANMNLSAEQRREAIERFNEGKQPDFDLDDVLARFRRACGWQSNVIRVFLEIQIQAAFADGQVQAEERRALLHIAERLGLTERDYQRLEALLRGWYQRGQAPGGKSQRQSVEEAYEVLGVSAEASDGEVKKAYRKLMSQHHPDKLVAKGLPEEMMKMASEKTHEIRSAYETVRDARGMS